MKSALLRTAPKSTRQWGTRIIRSIFGCGLPLSACHEQNESNNSLWMAQAFRRQTQSQQSKSQNDAQDSRYTDMHYTAQRRSSNRTAKALSRFLVGIVLTLPLAAQVTVTKSQTTVTATTGATVCTATSAATPTISLKCVNGTDIWSSSGPLSVGTTGVTYQMNSAGGAITWLFSLPTAAGPVSYQVTATPAAGCPAGAVCTSQGTF